MPKVSKRNKNVLQGKSSELKLGRLPDGKAVRGVLSGDRLN